MGSTQGQLGLFDNPATARPVAVQTKAELRRRERGLRRELRWWQTGCPGGPVDYCLRPGTDEGDASTAFRRDKAAEVKARIAATEAGA